MAGFAGSDGTRTVVLDLPLVRSSLNQRIVWILLSLSVLSMAMSLTACTSGGTLQAPSLSSLLTPQEGVDPTADPADTAAAAAAVDPAADSLEARLTEAQPRPKRPAGSPAIPTLRPGSNPLSPSVKNALAPVQNQKAPAQRAVDQIAGGSGNLTATEATSNLSASLSPQSAAPPPKKSGGFFSSLFKRKKRTASNSGIVVRTGVRDNRSRGGWRNGSLPGVRGKSLFGIDVEEGEEFDQPTRLASVTNRARRGSHGLLLQRDDVKVGCFPASLVRLLKQVERKFGRTPLVTSGYRSRSHNRLIRGARNSMHIHCLAADIQVQGVSKRRLARYVRSLPGRGGVGTYCHTKSVHVDVGRKRDWNRRCRRTRKRKS